MNTKPTKSDIAKILARLNAIYGAPRDRSAEMAEVMVTEWQHAMDFLPLESISAAVEQVIRTLKFWPAPSEIIERAIAHQLDLRDALGQTEVLAGERPTLQITRGGADDDIPFKPNDEQMARISAMVAGFKRNVGADVITDRMDEWAPASEAGASDALKALVAKQRAQA